ncbi:MAG: dethiobiotin synthase [Planctomycetes bacterium]|nr:dethiobiotin synthase [Planctomycetota bacterium]
MALIRHILGTDTGVGKTRIMGHLLSLSATRSIRSLPVKPVHSGCPRGGLGEDLESYRKFIPEGLGLKSLNLYGLEAPVSPHSAARAMGQEIRAEELDRFMAGLVRLPAELLLVEGVGGVCCPLAPRLTYLEFLEANPHPVLLVAKAGLGTLNHTLMSCRLLERAGLQVLAVILNEERPYADGDPAVATARWELTQQLEIPILGPLPHGQEERELLLLADLPDSFWA